MPDYKSMYCILAAAAGEAADIIVKAMRKCEEMYIGEDAKITKIDSKENRDIF